MSTVADVRRRSGENEFFPEFEPTLGGSLLVFKVQNWVYFEL